MSFFDSLQKGFNSETGRINDAKASSCYQTAKAQEQEHYDGLNGQSDSALLSRFNSFLTSEEDKKIIISILEERGYRRNSKGWFDRS